MPKGERGEIPRGADCRRLVNGRQSIPTKDKFGDSSERAEGMRLAQRKLGL
jgi:hypothetical protein